MGRNYLWVIPIKTKSLSSSTSEDIPSLNLDGVISSFKVFFQTGFFQSGLTTLLKEPVLQVPLIKKISSTGNLEVHLHCSYICSLEQVIPKIQMTSTVAEGSWRCGSLPRPLSRITDVLFSFSFFPPGFLFFANLASQGWAVFVLSKVTENLG